LQLDSLFAALLVLTLGTPALGVEPLRTVALSGTQAPGGLPGEVFGAFHGPFTGGGTNLALNNHGEVAFVERSFYSEGGGQGLRLIARPTDEAPELPAGVRFTGFLSALRLLDDGRSYVGAEFSGPGVLGVAQGAWTSDTSQGLENLYHDQMTVGGFNGFDFSLYGTAFNQQGTFATAARLLSPGVSPQNNHSIWQGTGPQSLAMVVREGDVAPGLPPITIYGNGGQLGLLDDVFSPPQINAQGTIVFSDAAGRASGSLGIWSTRAEGRPGGVIAVEGEQAPGLMPDFRFSRFFNHAQNDHNLVAFVGIATRPGPPDTNILGLWKETAPGHVELVVQSGQTITVEGVPLTIAGLGAGASNASPGFNSQGVLSFVARVTGAGVTDMNNDTLWTDDPTEGLRLIAREGTAAPGTPDGTLFGNNIGVFESYVHNKAGQVAFGAYLRGPGVGETNDYGIWATDLEGNLRLVVREGDTIDVNDGDGLPDLRVIRSLSFANQFAPGAASTEMGRSSPFNDRGQIAFTALFTDMSSGVFVSDFAMIPEPAMGYVVILGIALLGVVSSRRWTARTTSSSLFFVCPTVGSIES
jgi:hypothetical protein